MRLNLTLIAGAFVLALSLGQLLVFRILNAIWWRQKNLRRIVLGLVGFTFVSGAGWSLFTYLHSTGLSYVFATATSLAAVLNLSLLISLPFSGIINTSYYWWQRFRVSQKRKHRERNPAEAVGQLQQNDIDEPASRKRRLVLQGAAAIFPVSAVALGSGGMTRAFETAEVREMEFYYPDLPKDLDGLKILHVSDSHLGPYVNNDDIEALMLKAEPFAPDIMLFSGDVADDLRMLPDCIRLLEGLKTKFGAYASMGNHDYYRGAPEVRANFAKSSIPMLINEGANIKIGNAELFVGGADDPRRMGVPVGDFLHDTIQQTLEHAHSDAFKVVMSHRPSGFDYAAKAGVELTLAGHTHGCQIGFMGKPVFSEWGGERYVWGHYRTGNSRLYTSSGVGHWFPFRLGCPTEAPIIILRRGEDPDPSRAEEVSPISHKLIV